MVLVADKLPKHEPVGIPAEICPIHLGALSDNIYIFCREWMLDAMSLKQNRCQQKSDRKVLNHPILMIR